VFSQTSFSTRPWLRSPCRSISNKRGSLSAFYIVDLGAESFATYVVGCYSRTHYTAHASDLLFFEMKWSRILEGRVSERTEDLKKSEARPSHYQGPTTITTLITQRAPSAEVEWWIDLSTIENDIEQDLARRDFTINAMAVDLSELGKGPLHLIDPFNGWNDYPGGQFGRGDNRGHLFVGAIGDIALIGGPPSLRAHPVDNRSNFEKNLRNNVTLDFFFSILRCKFIDQSD
jgi:hypothetical protein